MRLLVVGKLSGQLSVAVKMAMETGAKVAHVETPTQATAALLKGQGADLLMVDYELDIKSLIEANEREHIFVTVVACGVNPDPRKAAFAISQGAKEFIPLPPDAELIAAVLAAVSDDSRPLVTVDPSMQAVLKLADQVAASDASILITGESGVGKEVMARYLHEKSKRAQRPFISVNCAAIPDNLLESELFGHEKGAFTGAMARRIGKFEEADGGTLLLDEISEMDARLQAKLLRVLQEGVVERLGSNVAIPLDLRVIAATNRDPRQAIADGRLREDLYYRINVFGIHLPPLRQRREDVPELAKHFLSEISTAGPAARGFTEEALASLQHYDWPGNVRELRNVIERAAVLAGGGVIELKHLALEPRPGGLAVLEDKDPSDLGSAGDLDLNKAVDALESRYVAEALRRTGGNKTRAAELLNISVRSLWHKLGKAGGER